MLKALALLAVAAGSVPRDRCSHAPRLSSRQPKTSAGQQRCYYERRCYKRSMGGGVVFEVRVPIRGGFISATSKKETPKSRVPI